MYPNYRKSHISWEKVKMILMSELVANESLTKAKSQHINANCTAIAEFVRC